MMFFVLPLISQEFDPAFLASLPENVREDLISEIDQRRLSEEPQYRRNSTLINNPKKSELTSQRFGLEFFSMMQSTLMPLNEPNLSSDYILDFGDTLEIQMTGQKNEIFSAEINREGSVQIPELGKIFVSGLSVEEASKLIKNKISNFFIGVESFVSLTKVRDIQVIVSGNVFNPGPYVLNGNSNIFHALTISGGPNDLGSFREIQLFRGGKLIETIDLYKIFIFGNGNFGQRLNSGDIVFVKPALNLVSIYGGVKRPGTYELVNLETLDQLVFFSNGFSNDADFDDLRLDRIVDGNIQSSKVSIDNLNITKTSDGDTFFVRRFPFRSVEISGAIKNPGKYVLTEGDGILELIQRAGGYTSKAFELGGILENKKTLEINKAANERLYFDLIEKIIKNIAIAQSSANSDLPNILSELKNNQQSGRVVAEFNLDKLKADKSLDVFLQDGDSVIIPEVVNHVYIFGQVSSQGTAKFSPGKSINHFIDQQGGFLDDADKKNIFIMLPNGETQKINNKNIFANQRVNLEIQPGSIIFVPQKVDNLFATNTLQAYVSILGNLGVSLASLSVIKD